MLKEMEETTVSRSIDRLVLNASLAANRLEVMDQSQVDQAVAAMARAAHAARGMLAAMAVEETGRGNYRDKVAKNDFAAKTFITTSRMTRRSVSLMTIQSVA
ncbi:acetaldehyde dehydrogenase [Lactiplantibacillus plantarum subsp. plantarum]|nr:acetaldehyde dehydrogenase [Lactiplantibacillus plantarum subsp. plantarum]